MDGFQGLREPSESIQDFLCVGTVSQPESRILGLIGVSEPQKVQIIPYSETRFITTSKEAPLTNLLPVTLPVQMRCSKNAVMTSITLTSDYQLFLWSPRNDDILRAGTVTSISLPNTQLKVWQMILT